MAPPRKRPRLEMDRRYLPEQELMWSKVVTGLATLQDAIQTLSSAYIKHTNAVLGEHGAGLDVDSALSRIGDNLLEGSLGDLQRAASPAKSVAGDGDKKERKKRQQDPNAPKRPLTPFFLYMQTARPIISADLGSDFAKGAVSAEGTRRWSTMNQNDKSLWSSAYKDNLRLYNARVHSYKIGHNINAKDMTDQEASTYAEEHNIGSDATADAQLVGEATAGALLEEDADGEPDKEPTPQPKTPKGKSRKSKPAAKEVPAAKDAPAGAIVPPSTSTIVPPRSTVEKEKTPDKKRKRPSKRADELEAEKEQLAVETPKSAAKPRKKKSKADS